MFEKLAISLADSVLKNASSEQREVLIYGAETFLHSIFSTIWLLVIGSIFGMTFHAAIIIAVFYINQTIGGGKHATTMWRCTGIMTAFLCSGLLILKAKLPFPVCIAVGVASICCLYINPLVLHRNKAYLSSMIPEFKKHSMAMTTLLSVLFLTTAIFAQQYSYSFGIGLLFSAISRLAAASESFFRIK